MPKQFKTAESFTKEPFFAGMGAQARARVEEYAYVREYEPRQIIFFPDDPCDHVYWVLQGRVKFSRVLPDGREWTVRHLEPGDMLGDDLLLSPDRHAGYAEALTPARLALMRASDFLRLVRDEGEVARALAAQLSRRLNTAEQVLLETLSFPLRCRVAATLSRLAPREGAGEADALAITHRELAHLTGATREAVTNTLHELRDRGLIRLANRRIHVIDPAGLQRAAETTED
ncbi:MAG TPA: Crp/Fnr family transcriptional regulator [Candidatus Hydrogenedentes bacterium]|nr:Crp/Fnr family transcriptional regulator [Candidatus Hydrogenedentota bacterium]